MSSRTVEVPEGLVRRLECVFGTRALEWARELPERLGRLAARWGLELEPAFPAPSYAWVAPARRGDLPVVVKLGVPDVELSSEIEALRLFEGRGAVRLLDADPAEGALLLERLCPGTPLATLDEDRLLEVAARVMRALWLPAPRAHGFPTLERWAEAFARLRERHGGRPGPLSEALVARAEALFAELCATAERRVVLHGDLHHWNVLRAEREPWLAIDPKGVVGDPAYEVGALLRNAVELSSDPARTLERGVDVLAERLAFGRERLLGWTFAHCVLSAVWSLEDRTGSEAPALRCAALAASLLDLKGEL